MKKFLILPVLMTAYQLNAVNPEAHNAFMENPFTPESHKFVTKMYRAAVEAESREPLIQLSSLEVTPQSRQLVTAITAYLSLIIHPTSICVQ